MLPLKNKRIIDKLQQAIVFFICLGLVAVIALYIIHMDSRRINADLYNYDIGYRFDYPGDSKLLKTEQGIVLENEGNEILLEPVPLYYKDQERVLLPMVMVACCPSENRFGRVDYFTELSKNEHGILIKNGKRKISMSGGFLHDGKDLYLFLEKTTVKWQDKHVILEPFSYAIVIYNQRLELYPSQVEECLLEDTGVCKVMAETESGYSINLSTDILCRADGSEQMLFSQPSTIKEIE
jgi:hypothetical protein